MAYDEGFAERIRSVIDDAPGVTEKKMFGGVAFLLHGKMFVGIVKDDLMVRVGPEAHAQSLEAPHVRPMDFAGRPMAGYVYVAPAGVSEDAALERWVRLASTFVATLPDKKPRPPTPKKAKQTKQTKARPTKRSR